LWGGGAATKPHHNVITIHGQREEKMKEEGKVKQKESQSWASRVEIPRHTAEGVCFGKGKKQEGKF